MTARRIFVEDLLCSTVHFVVFYAMAITAVVPLTGFDESVFWMLLMAVPFYANFFYRRYIRSTFLMILAHLAIPMAVFFLHDATAFLRVFVIAVMVVLTVYSLIHRVKGRYIIDGVFGTFASILIIVLYFVAQHVGSGYATIIYPLLIAIVLIGYELHSRMVKVDLSLEVITRVSIQPVRQILKFDHKSMVVMVGVLILFTFISHFFLTGPLVEQISRIRLPQIESDPDHIPIERFLPMTTGMNGAIPFMYMDDPPEPHPLLILFEEIIMFLVQVAVVLLILTVIVSGIIYVYKRLGYKQREIPYEDGIDEKAIVIPEKIKKARRSIWDLFDWQGDKTRRLFRKKILRHRKMGVPIIESDTPIQMSERIVNEDISALTTEYEKVRYGK